MKYLFTFIIIVSLFSRSILAAATKFVILEPTGSTVGTPVTVTVEARGADDVVDADYQNDVTLVTSGSATGGGLVDIVNGVGTLSINDSVAETVALSLSDTESTGLDVSSTGGVTFDPTSGQGGGGAEGGGGGGGGGSPVVSAVTVESYSDSTATVTWDTTTSSDSHVDYSVSPDLSSFATAGDSTLVAGSAPFQHRVTISGLLPNTIYYYQVRSIDIDLNATTDTNSGIYYSFSTTIQSTPELPSSEEVGGGGGGGRRPTTVTFSGRAFPEAKIFIIDKDAKSEKVISQDIVADAGGAFQISFVGVLQSQHSFGLSIKDKENRSTQTKFFNIDVRANDLIEKDIFASPTVGFAERLVTRGHSAIIVGNASPGNKVSLEIDEKIEKEAEVGEDGSYKVIVDSGILEFGTHRVRVKQIDTGRNQESDYSLTNTFVVSNLILPKTDLSGDGVVNIQDWSMFLSGWGSEDRSQKQIIDFNEDGKIDISDFSIFIRAVRK